MEAKFEQISRISDVNAKENALNEAIVEARRAGRLDEFVFFVDKIVSSEVLEAQEAARVLMVACNEVRLLGWEQHLQVANELLTPLYNHVRRYEDHITVLRRGLAEIFEEQGKWKDAASLYALTTSEQAIARLSATEKIELLVKTANLFLRTGDDQEAEKYLNRASRYIAEQSEKSSYRLCQARINEFRKSFLKASGLYYGLSVDQIGGEMQAEASPEENLANAVWCAIVGKMDMSVHGYPKPSEGRSVPKETMLSKLFKDGRSAGLDLFPVLERVHLGRLLQKENIEMLRNRLEHQQLRPEDREETLQSAIVEHDLLAASTLYANISFEALGRLLGTSRDGAESTAAEMIYEDRLQGSIDQVDGILEFADPSSEIVLNSDSKFESLCKAADRCCNRILEQYPQFQPPA